MEQSHPAAGQQRAGGLLIVGGDGLDIGIHLVLFNGRADDVDLVPCGDLLFQVAVHIPPFAPRNKPRLDGFAAGGQLIQHRDVQVSVQQQSQGARDGRGAHDEEMGAVGLAGQKSPLPHAKTVLLVHNGQPQIFELHRIGKHRMGTHHQPGAPVRNGREGHPPLGGFHSPHQQGDIDAEGFQPVSQSGGVLTGQQLGRGKHGALPAVLGGMPDGRRGHQRLAAAHIPLEQAIHGDLPAKIGTDLVAGPALCSGRGIGQAAPEGFQVHRMHGSAGLLPAVAPHEEDSQLKHIEFLKNQAAPGGCGFLDGMGRMDAPHRLCPGGHPVAGQQNGGQRVLQVIRRTEGGFHTAGDASAGQALSAGVDGNKRTGLHLCLGADVGVEHLPVGQSAAHPALKIVALTDGKAFRSVGGIEPGQGQGAAVVRRQHLVQRSPAPDAAGRFLLQYLRPDAAVHVIGGLRHRIGLCIINVAPRVVQKEVPHRVDAQLFEFFGERRADPFQVLDVVVQCRHGGTSFLCEFTGARAAPSTAPDCEKRTNRDAALSRRSKQIRPFGIQWKLLTPPRSCNSKPAGRR